jgi:hypothetical protein
MRQVSWKPGRAGVVCGFILSQVVFGAAFAQGGDGLAAAAPAAAAMPAPAEEVAKDPGPFGGCEPIGMTAAGELVFPLECKHKIKLPAAPVASEEQAPIAADKPAVAETKPGVTDDKPATAPETAVVEDKPTVETKAAAVEDKPAPVAAAPVAAEAKPFVAPETLTATDKIPPAVERQPVAAKPASPAIEQAAPVQAAAGKATPEKAAGGTPAKHADRHVTKVAGIAKQIVDVAKPVPPSPALAHAAAQLQTAGGPACAHFRSYNAATKSYLGFDGHTYACR